MSFIKAPMKGMSDFLPQDMRLREYVISILKETYASFGYTQIETPCIEHIENLTNKQGGDNEKLIFKILKRGEKLDINGKEEDLTDSGLRYDLTVPLARYYANNINELPSPFKAFQMGYVWRADRPQKGRFRQFMQCDIDILGEDDNIAEIDLISSVATALSKIGFKEFKVRINDRRILRAMALKAGFKDEEIDGVLISLDKIDKIGKDGVKEELKVNGFDNKVINDYLDSFDKNISIEEKVLDNINQIIDNIKGIGLKIDIEFDPTLVRGMSYYTGTIFEIEIAGFNGSVAGGGRYDQMIEKYSNLPTSACGFSIGFERIIAILNDINYVIPNDKVKTAIIVENGVSNKVLREAFKEAMELRKKDEIVLVTYRKKNAKYQKECLEQEGYSNIKEIFVDK